MITNHDFSTSKPASIQQRVHSDEVSTSLSIARYCLMIKNLRICVPRVYSTSKLFDITYGDCRSCSARPSQLESTLWSNTQNLPQARGFR